jgi:hypothetical protein
MVSEERILNLAKRWDNKELNSRERDTEYQRGTPLQGTYRDGLSNIRALKRFRFEPYLNDEIQDFYGKFWVWLNQFETTEERKIAFKIVSKITFITEDQIRYLQEVCFKEKLLYCLLHEEINRRKLNHYSYDEAMKGFGQVLNQCLFVPLTDSARYNQFVHVNGLENHSRLGLRSLDVLVHPDIRSTAEVVNKLQTRYKDKRILVILEDYCGSGKTFTSDFGRIAALYQNFEIIYFCPYIITEKAEKVIYRFAKIYAPKVHFEILYGMRLSNSMRVFSPSCVLFSHDEQEKIKELCLKYHNKYFCEHRFIGKPRSYPFGYRNGQLLLVMQSNCPNHTLPIIWASDKGWQPLFRRVQRYA